MIPQDDGVADVQAYIEGRQKAEEERTFVQRQKELREQIKKTALRACQKIWGNPEEYEKFLSICERFNRNKSTLGAGASNALLIYAEKPDSTFLIENRERTQNNWRIKKGEQALGILLPERKKDPQTGEWNTWQNPIKAFDISQFAEPPQLELPESPAKHSIREITAAIVAGSGQDTFLTRFDETVPAAAGCAFLPGTPAQMIMSTDLTKEAYTRCVFVCLAHYQLSQGQEYSFNPETNFIAKSSAYILCKRYGFETEPIRVFPPSVEGAGAIKETVSTVLRTSSAVYRQVEELLTERARQQQETSLNGKGAGR